MKSERTWGSEYSDPSIVEKVKAELSELEREYVEVGGRRLKPSQCYHFDTSPLHVLFNTNCPDTLKEKVEAILFKHLPNESSPSQ
jgi:hypothetical protein